MELYPIYDENSPVSPNIWYSLSGVGENPMMRVGHTVVHLKDNSSSSETKYNKGKLYFVGGANPSNCFNDVYIFDLDKLSWDKHEDMENFEIGRYEHTCFLNDKNECVIFGGANEQGSFNDVLKFNFENKTCEKVECNSGSSNQPNPRTIHVGTSYKNQILIFGGGQNGKTPVDDQKVYIFNVSNKKWITLSISGNVPSSRHGHVMISFNEELIFLHGGMKDENLFDDLWSLNLRTMSWLEIKPKEISVCPCPRAAHGGININKSLYIFGGINAEGCALDDLWKYDIGIFFNLYLLSKRFVFL
jgi:Rab9 effector protein with kelch motifs